MSSADVAALSASGARRTVAISAATATGRLTSCTCTATDAYVAGTGRWPNAPFDGRAVRLLAGSQPMLQDALELSASGPERDGLAEELHAAGLTVLEARVGGHIADGRSNASIAAELELSEAPVKAHLTKVYAKLGMRTRTQLAALMYDPGA